MWGWNELEWVDWKGCGPAGGQWDDQDGKANVIIQASLHLYGVYHDSQEVTRTVVWGRAALCLAGASCDWWGGNIEKLIRQITYC